MTDQDLQSVPSALVWAWAWAWMPVDQHVQADRHVTELEPMKAGLHDRVVLRFLMVQL